MSITEQNNNDITAAAFYYFDVATKAENELNSIDLQHMQTALKQWDMNPTSGAADVGILNNPLSLKPRIKLPPVNNKALTKRKTNPFIKEEDC